MHAKMKKDNSEIIKDFMGIFPNAASKEYCQDIIQWFEYNNKEKTGGGKRTESRQKGEGVSKQHKDSEMYWLGLSKESMLLPRDHRILVGFSNMIWKAFDKFIVVYGSGLDQLALHKISPSVQIQTYKSTQGYHLWHSDIFNHGSALRILVCTLYLNTVEEGGETEFLYQKQRVPAIQGTLTLFPAGWTHLHRGNPPLKGVKYLMSTWLEFVE